MRHLVFLTVFSLLLSACKKKEDIKVADELKYFTDFSEDDHTWLTDANHQLISGASGFYRMTQNQQNYQSWGLAPYSTINYNYSFSADAKLYINYPYYGGIGIVFNYVDDDHYYAYYIRNDGSIYVFKKTGPTFTTLVAPTFSSAIKTGNGQLNHVEVRQAGSYANFLVNSVGIGSCYAPRGPGLVTAGIAVTTSAYPYFSTVTGEFDNVSIKKIQ